MRQITVLCLALLVAPCVAAVACTAPPGEAVSTVLRQTNDERARIGLRPVQLAPGLGRAAQRHACDMAAAGSFGHLGSDVSDVARQSKEARYRGCGWAEDIAWGVQDVRRIVAE